MTWRYPDSPGSTIGRSALDDLPAGYIAELKMDGWRCVIEKTAAEAYRFTTRHKKPCPVGADTRLLVRDALRGLPVGSIVDSEWMARRPAARDEAIWFFDLLQWGGVELYGLSAAERLDALRQHVAPAHIVPTSTGNYAEFFDALAKRGDAEGVVLKRGGSKYIGSYRECATNPAWVRCRWRSGEDGMTSLISTFRLRPAAIRPQPEPIRNNERSRQRVLLTGLGCLSGQQDLFSGLDTQR